MITVQTIHFPIDSTQSAFSSGTFSIKLLYIFFSFCGHRISLVFDKYLGVKFLGNKVRNILNFKRDCQTFSKVTVLFNTPTNKSSSCSVSSSKFSIVSLFNISHSKVKIQYLMVLVSCCFTLHFPADLMWNTFSCAYWPFMYLSKASIQNLNPIKNLVVCLYY